MENIFNTNENGEELNGIKTVLTENLNAMKKDRRFSCTFNFEAIQDVLNVGETFFTENELIECFVKDVRRVPISEYKKNKVREDIGVEYSSFRLPKSDKTIIMRKLYEIFDITITEIDTKTTHYDITGINIEIVEREKTKSKRAA